MSHERQAFPSAQYALDVLAAVRQAEQAEALRWRDFLNQVAQDVAVSVADGVVSPDVVERLRRACDRYDAARSQIGGDSREP